MRESFEEIFAREQPRLERLANGILRDPHLAEEAVQQSWLKLVAHSNDSVESIGAWLTTLVTRTCIDALRRKRRDGLRQTLELDAPALDTGAIPIVGDEGPEHAALVAESIGAALLVVLDRLAPLERVAFVLHDVMGLPFAEIAPLIGRSPQAARQLASRARRRVRGAGQAAGASIADRKALAERFISAANRGDIAALIDMLDPDAVLEMDGRAARMASADRISGAEQVARFFSRRATAAHVAMVDDRIAIIVAPGARLTLVIDIGIVRDRIAALRAIADPAALRRLRIGLA